MSKEELVPETPTGMTSEWEYQDSFPDIASEERSRRPTKVSTQSSTQFEDVNVGYQRAAENGPVTRRQLKPTLSSALPDRLDSNSKPADSTETQIILPSDSLSSNAEKPALRLDFFDRMPQPTRPTESTNSQPAVAKQSNVYTERSLRKRREIQLHPFTIEKLQYKAQVGHAHDSHLSQSEIQKRRAIREKYVSPDNELLERAAAAKTSKSTASRDQHRRRNSQHQHSKHLHTHKRSTPSADVWQSRRSRLKATYGKKRAIAPSSSDADTNIPPPVSPVLPLSSLSNTQSTSRRTMQQQLDLLFPEFSIDHLDDHENDTRKKKRRRVIQDESESDNDDDSLLYLGGAEPVQSSDTSETEEQTPIISDSRQSRRANRLDVLRERRALKGILPMSFTKVFSKELTEDQKLLQSRRRANRQKTKRNRTESRSLANQVNALSISSDESNQQASNFATDMLNANDIFTDEEEGENDSKNGDQDGIWDLDDWLGGNAGDGEITIGSGIDMDDTSVNHKPAVLRDRDPIDRMVIRSSNPKPTQRRSAKHKPSTKSSSSPMQRQKRVRKYNYKPSNLQRSGQVKKPSRTRAPSRQSKLSSKQSPSRPRQQHIWRFMDVRKARSSPPAPTIPQPESMLEAEDQFFIQTAVNKDDLPAWVQALLQARQKLNPKEKENAKPVRPMIPSGVGHFYQSVADVTKVNWWQRHGRRRPVMDSLENSEPADIQADKRYWVKTSPLPSLHEPDLDSDIQIINPRARSSKPLSMKKPSQRPKQSNLFSDHGFSKHRTPMTGKQLSLTSASPPAHKVEKLAPTLPSPRRSRQIARTVPPPLGPSESQLTFMRFLNDTRIFPSTYSPKDLNIEWRLPEKGYIKRGFLKKLNGTKSTTIAKSTNSPIASEFDVLVTENGTFNIFGRCFNINQIPLQDVLDVILSSFWEAMKTVQDICFERKAVDADRFALDLCDFLSFVTIWLGHWVPLLDINEQQLCTEFITREMQCFQKRLVKATKLQSTLSSGDPSASLSVAVTQVILMWFVFSNDWEHRIQQLGHSCRLLQCNSQLDLMHRLLLWLGPEPLNSWDLLSQLILESWIYYFHALSYQTNPLGQLSALIAEIQNGLTSDGLDNWASSEMIWQWLFVLAELQKYDKNGEQTIESDNSQLWFAAHTVLKDTAILNGEGELSYSSMLQEMDDTTKEIMDDYIRALFSRVHQLCRLYPSSAAHNAILQLHSFYLARRFQDLATEQDSSFPEFFIDFIGYIPKDVSSDDSCFHIFLKTLCVTFQNEQASIEATPDTDKERKQLRRFLSQLAPTHVMTIRTGDQETGGYTSLGNHFNLSMLFAHVVSSDIMRRSIVQAKSFLNFNDSDHTARKMYFEAFTLLARIYAFHHDRDGLGSIVQLLNAKLSYLVDEYARMQARQSMAKQGFLPVDDWLADQSDRREVIECAFIYLWKIVRDAVSVADDAAGWFDIAVLSVDKGMHAKEGEAGEGYGIGKRG